jgi:pimeloyl-ACP methyl ester carboxylesterase
MRLVLPRVAFAVVVATILAAGRAHAAQVTNLNVIHRDGQTYVTWTSPPGTGWIYRLYASLTPIVSPGGMSYTHIYASVGDSSAYDRRLSTITGTPYGYRVDPLAAPLDPGTQGLLVLTPTQSGSIYYAVTVQNGPLGVEDRGVTVGQNSVADAVDEAPAPPRPTFQRTVTFLGHTTDVYTLWTTNKETPYMAAMANVRGLAFDCALTHGAPAGQSSLLIRPHPRQSNFLQTIVGTGVPGEWILSLDDPLPNVDSNTFWYGYHQNYNITSDLNTPPMTGVVHDYTMQRMIYTVLWARNSFGLDTTRVYAYGYSMGAIGSVLLALRRPDLIAGVMSIVGKYDFSFLDDPNPASGFNTGGMFRDVADRLWGAVSTNLPTAEGKSIYQRLNDGLVAGAIEPTAVPPILSFDGRNDTVVGWAEKIPFYSAMQAFRQGGRFYWDTRTHLNTGTAAWSPLQDPSYLYRFRTNLSFPAISNCSADGNPGSGASTDGDSVGCINGYIEWDTNLLDEPTRWETTLWSRDLTQEWGVDYAASLMTCDVTPRRLQSFQVVTGTQYAYTVTRKTDGVVLATGTLSPDSLSLITVPNVPVGSGGTIVHIEALGALSVGPPVAGRLQVRFSRNPMREDGQVEIDWPAADRARVDVIDVTGRVVRTLVNGPVAAGPSHLGLGLRGWHSGVYFVRARQGGESVVQRAVVIR